MQRLVSLALSLRLAAVLAVIFITPTMITPQEALAATVEINKKNSKRFLLAGRTGGNRIYCRIRNNKTPEAGVARRITKRKQLWESYGSKIKAVKKSRLSAAQRKKKVARLKKQQAKYNAVCLELAGLQGTPTPPPPASIDFSPNSLSFGTLASGEAGTVQTVSIRNTGNTPLQILSIRTGGSDAARFSVLDSEPRSIPAGQSSSVTVAFSAEGSGAKQGTLQVLTGQSTTPASMPLTGSVTARTIAPAFTQTAAITNITEDPNSAPTQMAWGPDGRLYVASLIGHIVAYSFNEDYSVASKQIITPVTALSNRNVLGIAFNPKDPPSPVRIYVAHSQLYQQSSGNQCPTGPVTYSGQVSVISGPAFDSVTPLVTSLPVSNHDMGVNGIEFDDNGDLFIAVGGMTNAGIPDCVVGGLPESALSSAIVKADLSKAGFNGNIQYVDSGTGVPNTDARNGNVDVAPGSDVSLFSTGHRNSFDLVWTTQGRLYSSDNGPGANFGPASTSATTQSPIPSADDELLLCTEGTYFGHPNRNRGRFDERQNVYHGPAEPHQSGVYAATITITGGSSNGVTEYRSRRFNSSMRGNVLIKRFSFAGSGNLYSVDLSADGRRADAVADLESTFSGVDVVEGFDGSILVSDLRQNPVTDSAIRILTPVESAPAGLHAHNIIPWRSSSAGGAVFTIGGSNFAPNSTVTIGGRQAQVTSVSPNRITGVIPAALNPSASLVDVVVRSGATASILPQAFRYLLAAGEGTGVWRADTASPQPLGEATGGFIKGILYVVSSGSAALKAFDPVDGSWVERAARPFAGSGHSAEVFGDRLYVFGGIGGNSADKVQIYDPDTNTWTTGAAMPFAAGALSSAVVGNGIYVAGGISGTTVRNDAAIYDPAANTWTSAPPLPAARYAAAGGSDGSSFFVFGGRAASGGAATATVQRLTGGTWQSSDGGAIAPMPSVRADTLDAPLYQGELYLIGGEGGTVSAYNPAGNIWRAEENLPTARRGLSALAYNLRIYAVGGITGNGANSPAIEYFRR